MTRMSFTSDTRGPSAAREPRAMSPRGTSRRPHGIGLLPLGLAVLALAGCHLEQARVFPGTMIGSTAAGATATAPTSAAPGAAGQCPVRIDAAAATAGATPAIGELLTCRCPADPTGLVRGTGLYAPDSAICAAALHDGVIDRAGGTVTLQIGGASPFFRGSLRHGVRSLDGEAQGGSFVFRRPGTAP